MLALDVLRREAKASFFYIGELEVRKNSESKKPDFELDLCGCIDGQIFIGEATREDSLGQSLTVEKERLAVHRELAGQLGVKTVVLATFADCWRPGTVSVAQEYFSGSRAALRLMTYSDLTRKP
jgi:hypothetical protein